ncbi:MAG: plasmid partitioning protein RepB [Deltaproteobacteria bacterium]|nr:plasmid partitioning protein RepB [Deltaproteobacteria bacterium]
MSRKDTLADFLSGHDNPEPQSTDNAEQPVRHRTASSVKSLTSSLRLLNADAQRARSLEQQISEGSQVVELDPAILDRSFISDRISVAGDPDFDALVESIKVNGQLVPILVRPHPDQAGRWQVAYGHRRVRAAELLQVKVKAVGRELTDEELVLAQGKENSERRDLSFIERASFAMHLEDRGFARTVIIAALCVDKTEVAKLISVARAVPAEVVRAIGPAPRAGRPRWLALSKLISEPGNQKRLQSILASESWQSMTSDRRFEHLIAAFSEAPVNDLAREHWNDPSGRRLVTIKREQIRTTFVFDERLEPSFAQHVASCLDTLYRDFKGGGGE